MYVAFWQVRPLKQTVLLLFSLCAFSAVLPADGRKVADDPEVASALKVLDVWVAATVAQREQPGLSIGIVHDQHLIWSKGYGFADLQRKVPATPATLYRIASISKLFTATAVMQLKDSGKLRLDDSVSQHLPWFKIQNKAAEAPVITIRHLLTHTSGLPREAKGVNWSALTFPKREEMIQRLAEQEAAYPAETEWKYSNLGVSLAGEIVAAVSGESWPDYVATHILKPLGMQATRVLPEPSTSGLAVGYGKRVPGAPRDVEPFVDIQAERPAGNLASNVEDLSRFISLQFRDKPAGSDQILSGRTLRQMHRIHWLRSDWKSGWGLGFSVRRVGEQVRAGHGGSLPGHRTKIEFAPAEKLGVIVLTNANDGDPVRYVNQAFTLVGPALARATAKAKTIPQPDPAWEKYVGTYSWKHSDVQVLILNGELTVIMPDAENPWESRLTLRPEGPDTFQMLSSPGSGTGAIGETVRFEAASDGRVTRLHTANAYYLRK